MGKRAERRAERREAVLDAATEILDADGAGAVTIAAVAGRVGASVGGLYRYFPHKQAIFLALQLRSIEALDRFLVDRLARAHDRPPLEALRIAFDTWPEFRHAAPTHHRLLDEFLSMPGRALDDASARSVHERLEIILGRIADVVRRGVAEGALAPGDAAVRTYQMWAALHGLGHFAKRDHLQPPALRVAALHEELFDTLVVAWAQPKLKG